MGVLRVGVFGEGVVGGGHQTDGGLESRVFRTGSVNGGILTTE